MLHYLKDTEHPNLQHITSLQRIDKTDHLWMDRFTIRNLELLGGVESNNSLLKVLDNTQSPMGARLLKRWTIMPLTDINKIEERQNLVEYFIKSPEERNKIAQCIKQAGDIERLVSKIPLKKINPREVLQIARGLKLVSQVKETCDASANEYLKRLGDSLNPCKYISDKIFKEIIENPPVAASKGNIIAEGVNVTLDDLKNIVTNGKGHLLKLQQQEIESTGISSLKIGFNNVFGYYLEVTHTHKEKVPGTWMRKQTLTNAERYITPELKEYEEKITGAEDKILQLELEIFERLLNELQDYIAPMQLNGHVLAVLDCLICFSNNALQFKYKKPFLHNRYELELKNSRHPVIERNLPQGESY
ncbi:MAG: DNA mismatch repair protein MutS, partial [Ginsengibacter sp.]